MITAATHIIFFHIMDPVSTPASEWSSETLAALDKGRTGVDDNNDLSRLSGREQAAAQLAAKVRAQSQPQTVDQQLAQTAVPVIPTRPAVAIVEEPTPGLHSTATGVPHATPISATAQTGGFTESSTITAIPVAVVAGAPVAPPPGPPVQMLTTQVPGVEQKTVPDLSAAPAPSSATEQLPSHNPFNPEHTPGFLDSQSRSMTGGTTPGNELPGGWGGESRHSRS